MHHNKKKDNDRGALYGRFAGEGDATVVAPDLGHWQPSGFPSPARDYMTGAIDLNSLLSPNRPATFLARAEGESLAASHGIHDGDLLIIDRSLTPRHGDVVVAYAEGEFRLMCHGADAAPEGALLWGVVAHSVHQLHRRLP